MDGDGDGDGNSVKTGKKFRVGSRKSQLALIQTNIIVDQLHLLHPHHKFEIVGISTIGDKILDVALSKIGEKSLFTKELEIALVESEVDFVVHSLKDLPTVLPEGLTIAAIPKRDDPRDAVILSMNNGDTPSSRKIQLSDLPKGSIVGTSSPRRIAQMRRKYSHLDFLDIRGNLNTRLKKLDDPASQYAGIILAAAGINRMGWQDRISAHLELDNWEYAVGQGALGVECASSNLEVINLLQPLNDPETYLSCIAERNFLRTLEGGCSVPVGVRSTIMPVPTNDLHLSGDVYSLDGSKHIAVHKTASLSEVFVETYDEGSCDMTSVLTITFPSYHPKACFIAAKLGRDLGEEALNSGANEIMKEVQQLKTNSKT